MIGALRDWVFVLMLLVSFLLHGVVLLLSWLFDSDFRPPEEVAPQQGKVSIQVRASPDARPEPREQPKKEVPRPTPVEPTPIEVVELPEPLPILLDPQRLLAQPAKLPDPQPQRHETPPVVKQTAKTASTPSQASMASEGAVDQLPQESINPAPPYPEEARAAGQQGRVKLRLKIDAAGKVAAASVHESSGYELLDEAALTTVRRWIFHPARLNGRAVAYEVIKPFEFNIRSPR